MTLWIEISFAQQCSSVHYYLKYFSSRYSSKRAIRNIFWRYQSCHKYCSNRWKLFTRNLLFNHTKISTKTKDLKIQLTLSNWAYIQSQHWGQFESAHFAIYILFFGFGFVSWRAFFQFFKGDFWRDS